MLVYRSIFKVLLFLSFLSLSVAVMAADLFKYELRNLETTEVESLSKYRGEETLIVLFEPDCTWCLRQIRTLNSLLESCPSFQALAVGVNGNRRSYLETLNLLRPDFPAYEISRELYEDLGGAETVAGTPVMLWGDANGELVTYSVGYQKKNVLLPALDEYLPGYCE